MQVAARRGRRPALCRRCAHAVGERLVDLRCRASACSGSRASSSEQALHHAASCSFRNAGQRAERHVLRLVVAPALVLGVAAGQAALAEHHAVRDADQLHVGEQHAGALVAVVEQHVDAGGGELGVQLVGRRAHRRALADSRSARCTTSNGAIGAREDDAALRRGSARSRRRRCASRRCRSSPSRTAAACPSRRGRWPSSLPSTWCAAGRCGRPRCRARSRACPCRRGSGRRRPRCGCRPPRGSGRSRPQLTPVRWKPSSFAPQTKSLIAATRAVGDDLHALDARPGRGSRRAQPQRARISASVAKRNWPARQPCWP